MSQSRLGQHRDEVLPLNVEQKFEERNMRQFNKSVEITHDGESTEMRTMRRSSESL